MKCDFGDCKNEGDRKITYGLFAAYETGRPHHEVCFCAEHSQLLWEKINGPVTSGIMYYLIEKAEENGMPQM